MGSGGSKKKDGLKPPGSPGGTSMNGDDFNPERRRSHVDTNPPPKSASLVQCGTCSRNFASDRIQRHAEVCAKTQGKHREIFDVQDQRLKGTDAEAVAERCPRPQTGSHHHHRGGGGGGSDWKESHQKVLLEIQEDKKHPRPVSALDQIEIVSNR